MRTWITDFKRPIQIGILAAIVAGIVAFMLPNYYRSEAKILPVEVKSAGLLGNLSNAAAAIGVGLPGTDGSDANYVDILASRRITEDLLRTSFNFHQKTWRLGKDSARSETLFVYLDASNWDQAVKKVGSILKANRDLRSKVLTVSAETRSAELSQQIVRRATNLLEAFVKERGQTRGGQKAIFAEARLADARKAMLAAELEFRGFLDKNRNYLTSADPSVRLSGIRLENDLRLRQQLVGTMSINLEQALMEEKNDMPILNVLDEANLPTLKSRPVRAVFPVIAFILATMGSWAWINRMIINEGMMEALGVMKKGSPDKREEAR